MTTDSYLFIIFFAIILLSFLFKKKTTNSKQIINKTFLPTNSKIIDKSTSNQLSYIYPRKGISTNLLGVLIFTIAASYVAVLTAMVAIFSHLHFFIVITIISLYFIFKLLQTIFEILFEEQEILLNNKHLILNRKTFLKTKSLKIETDKIIEIVSNKISYKSLKKKKEIIKKINFFEFATDDDIEWIVYKLNKHLK